MKTIMENQFSLLFFTIISLCLSLASASKQHYISALGDPGMKRDGLRVAFEAWNSCNEVGEEAPHMGSPRAADCFDLSKQLNHSRKGKINNGYLLKHKVSKRDDKLGVGSSLRVSSRQTNKTIDHYAACKELLLGSLCQVEDTPRPWQFWMVMLKNGNYDTNLGECNKRKTVTSFRSNGTFPCFGDGCMNQPMLYHQQTYFSGIDKMKGWFNGTYDLGSDIVSGGINNISFFEVIWEKRIGVGGWVFKHKLKTSKKYPWLMLYLRADATKGFSGGYHYDTRGMMKILPESPNFKVRVTLDVKKGGGLRSLFYLIDIGSCWKNDGTPCDGNVFTDVTRYSEMIINPATENACSPTSLNKCPPYHITPNNTKIHRNDTANFPYEAYHYYCSPGNAKHPEPPFSLCDTFSNPQPQELVQILPHPIWAEYGYPTKKGEGWVGDPRTWELDVGGLSSRLYFYQDPGTPPARRIWTSIDMGTEIYISEKDEVAEWTLSDFDVLLTKPNHNS